ncbi:hypothetical protein DKM44_11615 [Deinococcus irradiatisoli]|uniref:Uncharacterized protein n=1 Tax=Deinococcus irradiatisoli TaxID=2202254 RepID=A0A2Z3JF60_9DEIO|nr:hypothetical protein [Deinococcus irradiatisoli]AWN23793.1 hypothetical protein DKM44_11615 [Deinococcus irradiatisoli]
MNRSLPLLLTLLAAGLSSGPLAAQANAGTESKVTICHRTGSAKNPYVKITVSRSALAAHQAHGDPSPVAGQACGETTPPPPPPGPVDQT